MTAPRRNLQDIEKAKETVAWQTLLCLSQEVTSKHRKLALAHVFSSSRRNGARLRESPQ